MYTSRLEAQRDSANAWLVAFIDGWARANRPSLFTCACGATTRNPSDPTWMAHHQPHVIAASLERR
jgi:hypothetical protein